MNGPDTNLMEKYNQLLSDLVEFSYPGTPQTTYIRATDEEYLIRVPERVDFIKVLSDPSLNARIVDILVESKAYGNYQDVTRLAWGLTITLFNAKHSLSTKVLSTMEETYGEDESNYNDALHAEITTGSIYQSEVLLSELLWAVSQYNATSPQYGMLTLSNRARVHFEQWMDDRSKRSTTNKFQKLFDELMGEGEDEQPPVVESAPNNTMLH